MNLSVVQEATWLVELFGAPRVVSLPGVAPLPQWTAPIQQFRTQRNILLLARLALEPGKTFSREQLGEMLCPEEDPTAQRKRLRWELSQLRNTLPPTCW
ncbi:MAG: hypothetical protein OHK0029_15720 [Armatimonadaceae bacterium]